MEHELCNPLVFSLLVKSMGSIYMGYIRLGSNVLDNNPDSASPAHMRASEVYTPAPYSAEA